MCLSVLCALIARPRDPCFLTPSLMTPTQLLALIAARAGERVCSLPGVGGGGRFRLESIENVRLNVLFTRLAPAGRRSNPHSNTHMPPVPRLHEPARCWARAHGPGPS